jgi:hypothetical protein
MHVENGCRNVNAKSESWTWKYARQKLLVHEYLAFSIFSPMWNDGEPYVRMIFQWFASTSFNSICMYMTYFLKKVWNLQIYFFHVFKLRSHDHELWRSVLRTISIWTEEELSGLHHVGALGSANLWTETALFMQVQQTANNPDKWYHSVQR